MPMRLQNETDSNIEALTRHDGLILCDQLDRGAGELAILLLLERLDGVSFTVCAAAEGDEQAADRGSRKFYYRSICCLMCLFVCLIALAHVTLSLSAHSLLFLSTDCLQFCSLGS